ncbi:MAG: GNAT family N-acetyltransferase, partial [Chloroflexi bacterium]|nr:GNAT family N-acetyltransferase [Chloroflexota bacterium]
DQGALKTGRAFTVRGEESAEITREELADIARRSFGFCTIVGDEITSVASVSGLSSKYASLSIDTTVHFRRQGLATLACVALIKDCLERGLMPLWNCLASNAASANTALKLGMEEGPPQRESQWRPAWQHIRPSSGVWNRLDSVPDAQLDVIVWQRREGYIHLYLDSQIN